MKLVDLSITEFAKVLGSDAPAPGGGSAAAIVTACRMLLPYLLRMGFPLQKWSVN